MTSTHQSSPHCIQNSSPMNPRNEHLLYRNAIFRLLARSFASAGLPLCKMAKFAAGWERGFLDRHEDTRAPIR